MGHTTEHAYYVGAAM